MQMTLKKQTRKTEFLGRMIPWLREACARIGLDIESRGYRIAKQKTNTPSVPGNSVSKQNLSMQDPTLYVFAWGVGRYY